MSEGNGKIVVAFPGTPPFAQQAALAMYEAGILGSFISAYVYQDERLAERWACALAQACGTDLRRQLQRRRVDVIPRGLIRAYPFWEVIRMGLLKAKASPEIVDWAWDMGSHSFDRVVSRRLRGAAAVYGYEYTSLETFKTAGREKKLKILDLPAPDSGWVDNMLEVESDKLGRFGDRKSDYFRARKERRLLRRREECHLADVIVTASKVSRDSYIKAGIDPKKIVIVPYGAPPVRKHLVPRAPRDERVRFIWAGTFSLRKGAHYLVDALRLLSRAGSEVSVDVYGAVTVPAEFLANLPPTIKIRSTVPQMELFEQFQRSDALVFPTLADGFGMVITEALACGLPVITTEMAGGAELIVNGVNGLIVPPANADALAAAINWCSENRDKVVEMKMNALSSAERWQWSDYRRALASAVSGSMQKLEVA